MAYSGRFEGLRASSNPKPETLSRLNCISAVRRNLEGFSDPGLYRGF